MTSSIFWDRTALGAWAPSTQAMASTTFDLPLPFGPTTTVTPGSNARIVVSAKDLKPLMVSDLRNTATPAGSGLVTLLEHPHDSGMPAERRTGTTTAVEHHDDDQDDERPATSASSTGTKYGHEVTAVQSGRPPTAGRLASPRAWVLD